MIKYQKKMEKKLSSILGDDDWTFPPLKEQPPLDGLPECSVVRAGDGGLWVPIYVYISGRKKR